MDVDSSEEEDDAFDDDPIGKEEEGLVQHGNDQTRKNSFEKTMEMECHHEAYW